MRDTRAHKRIDIAISVPLLNGRPTATPLLPRQFKSKQIDGDPLGWGISYTFTRAYSMEPGTMILRGSDGSVQVIRLKDQS